MDQSMLRLVTVALILVNLHSALTRVPSRKPGLCPKDRPKMFFLSPCRFHINCKAGLRCCFYRGGRVCVKPVVIKPGSCPRLPPNQLGLCVESCSSDGDCEGKLKCCSNGCGHQCMGNELPPKPGFCPRLSGENSGNDCSSDYDCDGKQKCCSHPCGHQCVEPLSRVVIKPGSCPLTRPGQIGLCAEMCSSDGDCKGDLKCCSNGCGRQCMGVELSPKPGSCPRLSGENCINDCSSDNDCAGNQKCCSHRCGKQCVEAFPSFQVQTK